MIWLTWRQHRKQGLFGLVGLAVLAAVLIPTGNRMRDVFASSGAKGCLDAMGTAQYVAFRTAQECNSTVEKFADGYETWAYGGVLLMFLPLLAGMFWGSPVVAREVEAGTHRLVWTQDVTRTRWFLVKFGLVGGTVLLFAAGYAALTNWWLWPLTRTLVVPMDYLIFDQLGVVPVAYTLFALALGAFAGVVTRKVLPAMGATFVVFLVVRGVTEFLVRPNLMAAKEYRQPTSTSDPMLPNPARRDWVIETAVHNADGSVKEPNGTAFCLQPPPGAAASPPPGGAQAGRGGGCAAEGGYNLWTYQPAGRFTTFQLIEAGIFVLLAVALVAGTVHLVRRRLS
jgi:hypothetical protein